MSPHIGRTLGGLHHRVDRRLTGRQMRRVCDGRWRYTPLEEEMYEAGLQEVETYVSCRHNTVAQFVANRLII